MVSNDVLPTEPNDVLPTAPNDVLSTESNEVLPTEPNDVLPTVPNHKFRLFVPIPLPTQNDVLPTAPNDKFKIIENAPIFEIAPTGSYSALSFKNAYVLKFKDPDSGSTVITSGILGCNKNTVP